MSDDRSILTLMTRVLGDQFRDETWTAWRVLLKAMFALELAEEELETFAQLTRRAEAPSCVAREVWAIVGRRGGKSIIAALVAVYLTTCRTYRLAAGERGVFMVIAADRRQARVVRRYVSGLFHSTPVLKKLIAKETKTAIELTNGLAIEIHTASFRTVRGYSVVGAILDEIAFWPTDDAADPDREILAALRPAMATIPDAMLLCLSSPYARRGELYRAHRHHYGKAGDVLVIQAATRLLNPTVPQEVIDRAYAEDPVSAAAEYGAQFRSDAQAFVSREAIEDCIIPGVREVPPVTGVSYEAFVDPSGGSVDAFTLAIGHREKRGDQPVAVVDCVRERRPPFSPEAVVKEYADLLKVYGVTSVKGDRYAGEWPREAFRRYGIRYDLADKPKSGLYGDALALLNSGRIELVDQPRLIAEIAGLERRTSRGGRDSIDHAPGGHDDLANVACGLAVELAVTPRLKGVVLWPPPVRRANRWQR